MDILYQSHLDGFGIRYLMKVDIPLNKETKPINLTELKIKIK